MSTPDERWNDDSIQFPRLIAELVATQELPNLEATADSMDLEVEQVVELFDRAQRSWENIKDRAHAEQQGSGVVHRIRTNDAEIPLTVAEADMVVRWAATAWEHGATEATLSFGDPSDVDALLARINHQLYDDLRDMFGESGPVHPFDGGESR